MPEQPMNSTDERLAALTPQRLQGMRRGIEKESLRSLPNGVLALTPHPSPLGSALTHPNITTDFSESQVELITGVHASAQECLDEITQVHQYVHRSMQGCDTATDENLWVSSMPCELPSDETIPLGRYGTSNVGRAKSVYRMGLGHRYGRRMQTISGIHYNWSLPGVTSEQYFDLIRNFRRHAFLLLALYGASPATCASFVDGRPHQLQPIGSRSMHMPYGTSLRMGRLGYQSDAQATLSVSYNSLEGYAASLHDALTRPYPAYRSLGIRNPGGEYNQLATTLLQIENEFYGTIRPKRTIRAGERPLHALRERGVEYVEVRCMDLDPFDPVGISAQTMRFIDIFLLHCLLTDSPPDTPEEMAELAHNQHLTAASGRQPGLTLRQHGQEITLVDWAEQILAACAPIASAVDAAQGGTEYAQALQSAVSAIRDMDNLPSARLLRTMTAEFDNSFVDTTRAQSVAARDALMAMPWNTEQQAAFEASIDKSVADQKLIEDSDTMPFEVYRERYVSPERLVPARRAAVPA